MVNGGQINYTVNLNVNKQNLTELNNDLDKVIKKAEEMSKVAKDSGYDAPFKEAADAAADLKNILNGAWNNKLNQLDLSKVQKSFKDVYGNAQNLQGLLTQIGPEGQVAFQKLQNSILSTQVPIKQTSALLERMSVTFKNTIRYGISSSVFNNLSNSIQKAYNFSKDLNSSLNDIRIVSGRSANEMEKFAQYANAAAQALGSTTLDYTNASLIYYQQGLNTDDVIERTNATIRMANVLGTSANEVSSYMTAIWNNFDNGSKSLEYYGDVITALGAKTASSAEEISEGLEKFASVSNTVGLSYEYATTALATVVAATRQSADVVGTAFRTLFARIQGLNLGETLDDGTTLNKYSEALMKVGISIKDSRGQLKDMNSILDEMGSKWNQLDDAQRVALAQTVAGTRQYAQLIALMDNWDTFQTNLGFANNAEGTLEEQQKIYLESNEAHIKQLKAQWDELYMSLFDTDVTNTFVDVLAKAVSILNNFVQGLGGGANTILYIGSLLTGVFNQQLAGSIARITNNINAEEAAMLALRNQIELLKIQTDDYHGAENTELQTKITLLKEVHKLRDVLSDSEYQEMTKLIENISKEEENLQFLEGLSARIQAKQKNGMTQNQIKKENDNYLKELKESNLLWNNSFLTQLAEDPQLNGEFDNFIKILKEQADKFEQAYEEIYAIAVEDINAQSEELLSTLEQKKDELEIVRETNNKYSEDDSRKLSEAQLLKLNDEINRTNEITIELNNVKKKIQESLIDGEENISLSLEEQVALRDAIQIKQNKISTEIEKSERYQKILNGDLKSQIKSAEDLLKKDKDSYNILKKKNEAQQEYGKQLVTFSTLTSSIQSLSGIMNTLTNPNMDGWDKFTSILSVASIQAMNLYRNWDKVNEALSVGGFKDAITYGQKFKAVLDGVKIAILGKANAEKLDNLVLGENGILTRLNTNYIAALNIVMKAKGIETEKATIIDKMHAVNLLLSASAAKVLTLNLAGVWAGIKAVSTAIWTFMASNPLGWILMIVAAVALLVKGIASLVGAIDKGITKSYENAAKEARALAEEQEKLTNQLIDTANATEEIRKQTEDLTDKYKKGTISANEYRDALYALAKEYGNADLALAAYRDDVNDLQNITNQAALDTKQKAIEAIEKNQEAQEKALSATIRSTVKSNDTYKHNLDNFGDTIDLKGMFIRERENERKLATELEDLRKNLGIEGDLFRNRDHINIDQFSQMLAQNPEEVQKIIARYSGTKAGTQLQEYLNDSNIQDLINKAKEKNTQKSDLQKESIGLKAVTGNSIESVKDYANTVETMTKEALDQKLFNSEEDAQKWAEQYLTTYSDVLRNYAKKADFSEDLVDAFLGQNPTPEYAEYIQSLLQELDISQLSGMAAVASEDSDRLRESLFELTSSGKTTEEAMKILGETFKNTAIDTIYVDDVTKELIDTYGVTEEAFRDYVKQLQKLNPELKENEDEAKKIALMNSRMNYGLENLIDNYENLRNTIEDGMKNNRKDTLEYMEAISQLKDITADILNLEDEEALSDSFFESAENLELLQKASEGSIEAVEQLRQIAGNAIIQDVRINLNEESAIEAINELDKLIDSIPTEDLTIGAYVDLDTDEGYAKLNDFIEKSGMTAEQVQSYFNAMGYDPDIETKPIEQHIRHTGVVAQWNPKTQEVETHPYEWYEDATVQVPVINSLHYQGSVGKTINFKNTAGGLASKSSSGGGKNNEPDKMDPIETEIDRYHKINTQIEKVDNNLSKLQNLQERFVGAKLLDNLNKQWNLLNIQIENYNKKLYIANDEQQELANKLIGKGVLFNEDGTISNYAEVIRTQEAYVNSLIDNYNSMSKDAQEGYKDTVEEAKKDFESFKTNLDRYDELISDFIPGLQQSILEAVEKQIEINVEKFNKEITITLDMNKATRDWNAWKKKIIDGIKEDDILGNARARLLDFDTYFTTGGTGDIQTGGRHLTDLLEELRRYDNGEDNVYGFDRVKALNDLNTYYNQVMNSLTEVQELEEELYQDLLDEMDHVQEKFKEQVDAYAYLRDLINHDMKVIQLTLGEGAYGELIKFYDKQQENYQKQLDFQRQQRDFWEARMKAAEEGTKEWESARDKWKEAVTEFNTILEESLSNATAKFENALNDIFDRLNNKITSGMGLDYVNTEWDLINKNADRYLDTINSAYGIRALEKKYQDAINNTNNISIQQRLKKLMDEQLKNLQERERITQYDVDRAMKLYDIELARIQLEEAQQNKSQMRLRRDSQGNYTYQYIGDPAAIQEAQDKLDDLYNSLYNFDKERYKTILNDIYSIWNDYQQSMHEAALINDPEERAEKEKLIQDQYNELMMQAEEDYQVSRANLQQSFFWDYVHLHQMTADEVKKLTQEEKDMITEEMIPIWENGVSRMAEMFNGEDGFARQTIDSWNEIKAAENQYAEDVELLEDISRATFESITNGEDHAIEVASDLIKTNEDLINSYGEELDAVQAVYNKLLELRDAYKEVEDAAKAAAEAGYRYRHAEELEQIEAAKKAAEEETLRTAAEAESYINPTPETSTGTTSSNTNSSSSGGDGVPRVGDIVSFDSGIYTENSYGGGLSGAYGRGGKVKITIVQDDGRPRPIHIATTNGGALGWVSRSQISGYDTGGYTGNWSGGGKIGLLHQKELVLNAQDTENMLNTVAIMRSLAYSLGSSMLARMAGASAQGYSGGGSDSNGLEQNVHIDAQFPNVRDSREIEEALNNLVNAAAQRAFER